MVEKGTDRGGRATSKVGGGGGGHQEKRAFRRMENGHLLQRKKELVEGKGARVQIKGALIRVEKGKRHFYKLIGAFVNVQEALFLCTKGHFLQS